MFQRPVGLSLVRNNSIERALALLNFCFLRNLLGSLLLELLVGRRLGDHVGEELEVIDSGYGRG